MKLCSKTPLRAYRLFQIDAAALKYSAEPRSAALVCALLKALVRERILKDFLKDFLKEFQFDSLEVSEDGSQVTHADHTAPLLLSPLPFSRQVGMLRPEDRSVVHFQRPSLPRQLYKAYPATRGSPETAPKR